MTDSTRFPERRHLPTLLACLPTISPPRGEVLRTCGLETRKTAPFPAKPVPHVSRGFHPLDESPSREPNRLAIRHTATAEPVGKTRERPLLTQVAEDQTKIENA